MILVYLIPHRYAGDPFFLRIIMYYVVEVSTFNKPNIPRFFTCFDEIIAFSVLSQSSVINTILIQHREVKTINI